MIRLTTILLGLSLSSVGFGQTAPKLSEARGVSIGTIAIDWNPAGNCLAYWKAEDSGIAIGLYQVGAAQGTLFLHLKKGDDWNLAWFGSQDAAVITVTSSANHQKRVSAFLLEAKALTATTLFDKTVGSEDVLTIDVNLSPLLEHGVFKIQDGDYAFHYTLPPGGTALVPSTDLDVAEKQGFVGPKWAVSGTAFYMDRESVNAIEAKGIPSGSTPREQMLRAILDSEIESLAKSSGDGKSEEAEARNSFSRSLIQSIMDTLAPAPGEGDVGLELMPDNGVLRQVRSPGPWHEPGRAKLDATPQRVTADVTAGPLSGKSQSLWLIAGDKSWSLLVSPSVKDAWLSPNHQAIAYMVDGVLFIRNIKF